MYKIVEFSHLLITDYYNRFKHDNMVFVDATCGRGSDTIFMAKLLKENGKVYSYDIQEEAINYTSKVLKENKIENVVLYLESHEAIKELTLDLVIYNLGYLPNGDKSITTNHVTTLKSIELVLSRMWMNPNMLIIIVLYPGHEEGLIESQIIDNFAYNLDSKKYLVCKYLNYNRPTSPYIITISENHLSHNKVEKISS